MSSIARAYFEYGSTGLTEAGRNEGLKHLGRAAVACLLMITGIALFILCELYSTGTLPSSFYPFPHDLLFRYLVGTIFGLVLGSVPITFAIGGCAAMEYHKSFLYEDLTDQDKTLFLVPPTPCEFKDHQNL